MSWRDRQQNRGQGTGSVPSWKQKQGSGESADNEPPWKKQLKKTGTSTTEDNVPAWKKNLKKTGPKKGDEPEQEAPWKVNLKKAKAVEKSADESNPDWKDAKLKRNEAKSSSATEEHPDWKDAQLKKTEVEKKETEKQNPDYKLKPVEKGSEEKPAEEAPVSSKTDVTVNIGQGTKRNSLVIDVQMEAPATKPKIFVLELSEQEWKENHQMGAFAGMKISYTMEGERYKIEMTGEQYEKYKKNCENPGYVLRLSEAEWQEHQVNAMFAGLKISYTMDDGVYVVRLTDEQYEEYKKNSGGYSLCLTAEQYEELQKYSVFAGINITYTMQNGNYVIKLTNAEYQIYLKNRQIAGPITSMQYNITMASGGRYTLVLSAPQWAYLSKLEVLHQPGVQVDEQSDGSVTVYLDQEHYSIFLSSISAKKPRVNVSITDITVEVDSGGQYILVLAPTQWITLRNQGAFAGLDLQVEELGNGDHKVILSPEEYQMFMSSQNQGERTSLDFRVTVTQDHDYVLHLTEVQFENLKQNGSFGELDIKWVHGPNGEILVTLNTSDYDTFQSNVFQITAEAEAVQRDNIQKRTFTRWANVQLKADGFVVEDLYEDLKDGLRLIALLENLSKKPIKKTQRVKMNIHKLQNLEYALRHLEKEGVKLVNISNEDILSGNHKLTLGLIWTIICRYQFENLSMGNVTGGKLKSLLLAKCNQSIMIGYPPAKAHNFTSSFQDGMAFCAMIAAHAPDAVDMEAVKEMEPIARHELAFKVAEERFDVHQLLEPSDTVNNPDEKSIMTYIAALTAKLPDLGVHVDVATVDDYATHARTVKQFLGDKKNSWDNDPLPVTVETIQAEIDALRAFGANQMPDKHKEIDLLAKAYKDLEGKTEPEQLTIITDEALTPKDLSESFNVALNAKKGREQKLLNLLKKKENEGSDLEKIDVDCGSVKEKLRQLAGEVSVGKLVWPKASQPEIKRDCDRIDGFIDVITADLDNITKKYNEVAEYATDTDTITPIAVKIDELNTEFEQIVEDYRAFISQHMKDSEDTLLSKIKDLSEKLDAKRTGLSNIQWTNDLSVLKSCLDDVEKIQADIKLLEADKDELKAKHESLMPSDPLYGKFDAVLARCIEKFDDTQKQADRSHHDLSILRKFLEGVFQELPWIKKQEQNEIKRRWHIVVDPSAMPPCSQVEYQAELAKLTQHESSITQLIKVAKNLIKESPELDVLVQEPMFRLEVEWKRLYNLMQCCNTQLKIYEENLPFYRILNSITKNTNDINELLLHPNKEDPTKYKQQLEQHNKNIEIGLNQLEKLDKYPSTGYFIDRSNLPSEVNGLGDVYLRGEKILRPGDTTQITRVGDNLVCEVKLNSGKKELLPIVYFTRPYEAPILKKFIMHHKQRVEDINVKVEALTKDLISQKIFEEMDDVLMWEDLPDEIEEEEIARIKADCQDAIKACKDRGDDETADALTLKLNLLIKHTDDLAEKARLAKDVGAELEGLEEDIKVEMEWCQTTEKTIDDLLVKVPPKNKQEIEMNVRIYDEIASQFPPHSVKQKEIVVSWQNLKDKNLKLDKDLDPSISDMQDIMRNIKKKKNDLYDKTTIEFVDHEMKPLEAWVDVARKRVDQIEVDGDLPKLQKIIAEVNVFLEDMKEKEKDMDRLNSKWEEGVSLGIENPDIERRIAKLNSDWDELCDLTEAKSNTANTALQNMEDYDAALESVDIWIAEKQDVLKDFAEIPMDREKLDRMLGEHEVTIRDIEDKKPNIEAILEKGGLIVEAIKHPATKKAASDKLNDLEKNYRDLEINCAAITRKLQDALGDMSDLDDRLREVVRWEDESKDYIQKQEPVSEDPAKLKEQIANLCEFKEAVNEMRPEIDYVQNQGKSCLDKYGDKDSKMKELKMILANVNVNWEFIESWLKNRENELNAAKKRNIDKLFADIEAMIKWLGELKDLLNNNQVKSMININPIIDIIRKVQGELDEKKPHYLMLCEASAKEVPELEEPVCFELEAKTDKMKKLWNELCLDCEVQTRDIEDFVNKSAEVDESLDNLLNWANVKYGDLVKLEDVKPEELCKLLKPHEEDVNQKAPEVVGKLADVEQLLGPVADRDMEDMEVLALINKHDALARKWQDIQDELEKLRKRANEYTDQESWFLDICLKMDKWLQIKKRILLGQPIVTMESFADDLKYHRDLLTEYEAKQIEFNRIWEISANIIKAVADPKKKAKLNLIRNKLADLWEEVYGLCMRRHYQFIEILKEIYRLEFRLVLTVEWLVETHYRLKHKPHGDFVQDIAFLKEIEANQKYVHQTFEDGRRVLRCVRAGQLPPNELPRKDTLPNIEQHLIDLHNHWERLLAEIVLEKQRIDQVMAPLESHAYRMDKLLNWLLAEQVKVEKDAQLGGTTNQLLRQLNAVKQLEVDLNNNRDRLKNLNEEGYKNLYNAGVTDDFLKTHGTCLARSCPQIDDNVTYIAAMNTTWKHLECHVREKKMRLEDLTDRMEKFDKLLQAQHHWLDQCSEKIGKTQTDTGGSKDNEAIITELQTLHAQLLATNKIGLLLVHQHGECVLPTIGKILDLQMHFDNTCSEAHSKHCHIDKSQLQLKLFRDSLEGMLAWLHKQRKAVDEKCRLVGSDGKLDELIEWHRKTKQDIDTHRGVRDSILLISDRFIKELGHAEMNQLKTSVSELKDGFSNLEISFKKAQYKLEEENCNLRNISEALSTLNKWIHSQQKFVKARSTSIPDAKAELLEFKSDLRAGMVQLEEREIHVTVTLNSAHKQILKIEEQSHQEGIQKMANQVKENWEKLRKNFEKLASNVDAALNNFALNDIKLQEMYQWAVNFYKMVTNSIEDSITLVYEEQLYLLKSYEYQITEKVKVLVTLKIAEAMEEERYSALYVKIEAVISKMNAKIEERKEELEITISQLEEFEIAVDKALTWMAEQELILKQIVVIQDEESLNLLITQKGEVYELIDHVKDKMQSIESVLETGEDIGLKEMKRFSLYTKLVNLKTRWTQLDVDCHQKIIQIELNIISIKEYKLLQWLVKQEERLTVNIEIIERVELEEILALYKEYKIDYEEVRALYLELKDKVDLVEGEELERDIRIIETHWVNVYELLIAAFAVVSAREEADTESDEETELDSSSAAKRKGGFAFDIEFGDEEKESQDMVPVRDEPGTIVAPDINVNVENKPVLESAPAPLVMGGGWDGSMPDIKISVQGGNVAMTNSAAPGAERISSTSSSEHKKQESKENGDNRFNIMNSGSFNGFGGGAGLPLQLPVLPQLQYNRGAGNHVCCGGYNSVTEVDSSRFLSAIVDLRSWITSHLQELMNYNNPDIDAQLQWLTDLNQVLMNQEVTIQDTHSTIKLMLPKLSLTAKDQLISQIEGMLNDFSELKSLVNSRLLAVRKRKAECADFEDTMAEFEEELIDAEEIFDKIKGRIYNFDEIIVNIESLAELEGKLELWRSLFDKGVEGAGCPPSLQHNTQIIATQWSDLFESVADCKALLKSAHENVAQIELDLKGVHEWLQIKESTMSRAKLYTTIDEMEVSSSTISQIGMDAQNKRLFFDPLKFSAVEMFTGVSMSNIREFYSSLSTRVVNLWQTAEDLSINFRQNINLVHDIIANCESFLTWVKLVSNEVDGIDKPGNKEESLKILSKLEDYIDLVPEREREFDNLVERVRGLDNLASSLIIGHINQCSQVFNVLKMLLKKKHSIVSGLVSHFSAEEGLLKKVQDALQEAEKVLNSPMLIPCNIEGLDAINARYGDISKQLERTKEMIDNLAEHNPELAAQLRERCLHASDEQHHISLKVGEALGSLKSLHQQLDELIGWENHMVQKIGELSIPAGSKDEVLDLEETIKELGRKIERQELTYNRLEDKANNVIIQFELGTGQEIEEKLGVMQDLWRDIVGATAEHKSRVEKAIFHFDTFDSTVLNHEAFLQSQQSHFNFIKQNPENETAKERNEKLREELNNSSLLDDMTQALTQMKEMFPDVSVADEFAKLQTVKSHQESFVNKVEEHSKYLEERITASVYDNIPVRALLDWVEETREQEVQALEDNMPGSLEECELELDKHEKILQELAAKQREVIKAQTEAEKLFQEKGLDPGVQKLAEEMRRLQKQWDDTTQIIRKRQKALEERLVTLGALSDDIEDQFSWITRTRQSIDEAEEPSSDLHLLIEEISLIKNIRSEVGEHGQDVTDVCAKGHEILSSSKNSDKLSARLRDLTDAWQDLNDVARDRHILLQNSLQVLQKAGESETDALYSWLKEVSENLRPAALPPNFTSQDILDMLSHVQGIRAKVDKKLAELTSHIDMMKGKGTLKGKTKRLEQSLIHTLKRLSDQETYLQEHQAIESQLDHLADLQTWLDQSQIVVEEISSLDSLDADQVRVAVQCYEQLKTDLETHVKDMDSLSGIPPECIPANYRTSLTEVLLQWESLCQTVSDRQVDMGELGRALSSFDESLPYLTTVKDELSVKVSATSSESANIDEISMKLQQHKLISRDITKLVNSEQSRNLERVLHSVNKILGCDNVFSQEIAAFRSQWEMFVDTVNEQRNSLTEEKLEWKQFNDSCSSKMTWIKERQLEVEEMIRECESGSKENLHQNMETLRVLSKSFALYEEQIQQVAENSHKFTNCMKAQLEKLKEAWLMLGEKMELANSLLDSSYNSDNFSQSLQTLFQWLGDKEQLPVLSSIIPKDLELLDKDTQSLKELFTELEKHAEKVEELVEMDTGTSDTFLVEQVELLEQRWNNICDIAAAREEEMKAIRIQLEAYEAEFVRVQMWLDTQEEKLTSMRGQVSSEAMLEQHLGYLDEFLKLETFAQAELMGLREAAKRLHGNNLPHKVSSALNKNSQRWNTLCQQAKSTKVNLQQRLRLVLRHRSDLDEVIKSLNEQLDDVETQLSYTEQLTDTKEVLIEKEKFIEKTIAILVNVEEDYNSLQKLMLSCPIELQETYTSHVNSIEDVYSKIAMRHKVAVQSVSDQVNIVNKYGQHLDDTTGRIVSLLIELQDKIPFSSSLEDITNNIEFFKTAVNKYKTLNSEVRSIQSDSIVVPFFKTDLKNVKDRLDALDKFSKQMMEVLLKGSDISTEFRDGIAKTTSFLQEISEEVETSITPYQASDSPQDLQSALNTIIEIKHCMNTRGHLIEDIEATLKKFDEYFNVEPLKTEYEEVCGSWFEQLHHLDEMETKLSTSLSSKTFFQNQLAGLKATFQEHRDTLKSLEEVTTEAKLHAAIETLEKLLASEKTLSEEINSVVLEGKNIIRTIDNMEDMKRIQLEVQSLQSAYRVIQNSISMKHKKFTTIRGQLEEYKSLIQSHELFIESTQSVMENLSSVLDEGVLEENKTHLAKLENSILDKRLEHDKIVNVAETVLRCLADESYLKETATSLKIRWNKMNCAMTEAATSIENNSKSLKNLYNGIAMLKKETLEKSKMIVSTKDVSNDIAVLRQQHRQMKMTLKELDVFTSTVERIKLSVESSLEQCSEVVRKDLTERLAAFNDLWNTTKSQTESGFREIDNRLGGVRRYQEQLSEEHAWYAAAEERYTAIKHSAAEMDLSHVTSLTSELNLHTATVLDLRENIVKLNFDQTVVKECTSLISNYDDLKGRLEHLVSVFEAENSKTYKLISHIDMVQHQVYERGRNLASHQAVSSHYETVKYQAEQLEQFMGTLSSVENDVVDLIRSNKNSSLPQEVQIKIQHLSESWNELAHHVSAREQKIRQMLQLLQQFEDSYNDLSSWLREKNKVLISSLPYDIEGVHSHHELLVSVKSTLNTKYHLIQIVTEVGNTLVTLSSAADVEHIQTKLHKIKQSYEKLENDISLAIEQANEAALGLQNFKHSVDSIRLMLEKYEKVVEDLPNFGGAVEELASFIESHLSELDETYEVVERLQSVVRGLEDNIWSGDNSYLKNILLDINTRYKRVRSKLKSSHDRIHQSSVLADQFLGTIQNVITWIGDMTAKITVDLPADQEQLLDLASVFHPLNREVVAKETSIDLLIEKGAMLLAEGDVDDGHCTVIEEQLSRVRDLYDELKLKYKEHAKNLESALSMCNRYQNKIDSVMGKLSRYDTVFLGADKPDIDHISHQIDRLEQSKSELADIEKLIIEIESINVVEGGDASFSRRKLQLRTKLETVVAECHSKIKTLQLYESKLKTIESDMAGLEQWINTSCDTLSGNLGTNSTLLESVKLLDSEISVQKTHLVAVRRNTEKFLKEYKLVKQGVLIQRLMTIEENFQELEDIIVERRFKCEEEEQQVAGFQEKMNNMFDWIHSKEQELASQSKVTLVKEQATAQLQDHIKMQQDFGTMQTHMDTLNTMGFDLFTKFEERYPELDQQLATLNTMWENTCRGCVDRQRVLEESISSLEEFWSNYNEFRDWLRDSSEAMEVEPDPGATLLDQLNTVKELLRNLEEKKPTIEHLKELAGKIPGSILAQIEEEEAPLKTELEEAEEMLNNQVECLKSRKSRLEKGCAAVAGYNEDVGELVIWLKEFEPKLNVSVQLDSADPKEIKNLQGKQRVWMKTLAEKQGTYEELTEKGRELLDKSEESEQHGINAILLNLAEAWEQVGALVEEKRIKLEDGFQHAHQFDKNFKELSSWVQEAEAQVTEPMDDNDLHNRVERQQLLVSGLKENEARFDHIFVLGEGLISLCTPTASAPVSEKLESLQGQWESLKQHCVKEQETLKGTVENMVEVKSKVDFYSQWVNDVVEHCSQLNEDLPDDLSKIRKMVDDFYLFTKELQNQAPFLNDLLEQCAVFEEQGTLSPDLINDIEEVKDKWAEVCQFLDERFVEMRQKQLDLARQPAPKPAKEPKTDAEKVDLEVQNVVASCCCENKFKCEMVSAGKYKFGEMQKKHLVRILRTNIVVRVGGGWETMESFLNQHDPCRVTGKGNIESILANLPKPGEALGLMSANLTRNRTVVGYTGSTKSTTKTQSCSGTVESVVETETDTDFAHAKGTHRHATRNQKSSMSGKTTTRTPLNTSQRKMFTPVTNSGKNGGNKTGRARSAASTSTSSLSSRSLTRSTSGLTPEKQIPLRRSKSYNVGEPEPVAPKGRVRHPSGGSGTKVLSDRFSTFSPAKGIKKSESDSDIQKRRSGIPTPTRPSGIPVPKSRSGSLGRSPSGDITPSRTAFSRSASLRGSKRSSSTPAKPRIVVTDDDDETF